MKKKHKRNSAPQTAAAMQTPEPAGTTETRYTPEPAGGPDAPDRPGGPAAPDRPDAPDQQHATGQPGAPRIIDAISPSGAIAHPEQLRQARRNLAALGYELRVDRDALKRRQRFAGTDEQRAEAFVRAARSDAPIVMATRGGYGLTRLLDRLDYRMLARSGKKWVGLSDFTAFHLAMLAQQKAVTWAGPCVLSGFGRALLDQLDETTRDGFFDAMEGRLEAVGFRCTGPAGLDVSGRLWGGNLSIVCALVGTPYFPKVDGGILFLEDVNEHPFRIERMLTQLLWAGVLDRQKAIVLGAFSGYALAPNDRGFDLPAVRRWLATKTATPIVTGLPHGHVDPVLTLPHGAKVGLAIEGRTAFIVLPHAH